MIGLKESYNNTKNKTIIVLDKQTNMIYLICFQKKKEVKIQ
jgi:hypothetical protein